MRSNRRDEQISESAFGRFRIEGGEERGANAVLRCRLTAACHPPDASISSLNTTARGLSIVVVPSRDGMGTNAILRRPPDLIPSHFGPAVWPNTWRRAVAAKAACKVIELHRIAFDIDGSERRVRIYPARARRERI